MTQQMSSVFDCLGPWGSLLLSSLLAAAAAGLAWGNVVCSQSPGVDHR